MNRIILIFIDGVGIGVSDPDRNPFGHPDLAVLNQLLFTDTRAVDASMGVAGLPQSATGQTALLTGVNAAQALGTHREGFPNQRLKGIIEEHNIFRQFGHKGLSGTFANAYRTRSRAEIKYQSVTTVATFSALGQVRGLEDLRSGAAVYQDPTNRFLADKGYRVPVISPEQAGENLVAIAEEYHLTLYEYFKTDRAGHSQDIKTALAVLRELQAFLSTVVEKAAQQETLVIITSDHGNIEDLGLKVHTGNPVPLVAQGWKSKETRSAVREITDVTPALVQLPFT